MMNHGTAWLGVLRTSAVIDAAGVTERRQEVVSISLEVREPFVAFPDSLSGLLKGSEKENPETVSRVPPEERAASSWRCLGYKEGPALSGEFLIVPGVGRVAAVPRPRIRNCPHFRVTPAHAAAFNFV
jgi:hypothetical protein